MGRKSSSGRSRGRGGRSSGRVKNIYFGKDSYFKAVKDIGKKGVNTPEELMEIAAAQLSDLKDLETYDKKSKRMIKWNSKRGKKIWSGRVKLLWDLFYRLKEKGRMSKKDEKELAKFLKIVGRSGYIIMNVKSQKERTERIKTILKKAGFKDSEIKKLLESTNK